VGKVERNIFAFLHVALPFAGCFIETASKQRGTGHWFAMGHYSRPVSRSERHAVPTEMGEGREPGVGQGSVDEGGGQFSLTSHPHHPENLS